jgi:plasmid segregation protein ParM
MNTLVTRAIDVGYGNTKFTTADSDHGFSCKIFPSIAPHPGETFDPKEADYDSTQFVDVDVAGQIYRVGPEAASYAASVTQREIGSEFSLSDSYVALVKGALFYMREPMIDMLVLGLPLTTFKTHKDALREKLTGGHTIPNPFRKKNPGAPLTFSVEVKNVRVVAQPVGAFFNYVVPRGLYNEMNAEINLIIDVGYGTIDWYVAQGTKAIPNRCGGYDGGVSTVVNTVAKAANAGQNNFGALEKIDKALRLRETIKLKGKPVDIHEAHGSVAANTIRQSISVMLKSVGNMDDVDNIIVTGGGAALFYDELTQMLPDREDEIIKDDEPVISNVCGFQYIGEQWAENLAKAK